MGNGWSRGQRRETVASSELYVDKVVKFIPGLLQLVLAIVVVALVHATNEKCEQQKIFSFLVLCQSLSLLFILLLWYWCYGQDLANTVQELIHHTNHLTNQYKRYNEGQIRGGGHGHREVTEVTLQGDLDNYLEYLQHVLTVKGERLYVRHLVKWIIVLAVCFLWLLGFVVALVQCGLPGRVYMKVLWVLPMLILAGTLALLAFHIAYDLCRLRDYEASFFYQAVPGAMDARLSRIVTDTFNPRYVWLLSRHCWQNSVLCTNAGLSKALARKFCYISHQNRKDRWRDQHFPTLRSDQVERFQLNSEQFAHSQGRGEADCCQAMLWCGLNSTHHEDDQHTGGAKSPSKAAKRGGGRGGGGGGSRRKWKLPGKTGKQKVGMTGGEHGGDGDASSGYSSGFKPAFHTVAAEDGYMTPHLFARKLAKESVTPEQLLDEEIARHQQTHDQTAAQHSRTTPRDDLPLVSLDVQQFPPHQAARGLGLSRDDTELDYGAFYQPHDLDPHRMQREYDPLTYGVRMSVRKEMARDVKAWR